MNREAEARAKGLERREQPKRLAPVVAADPRDVAIGLVVVGVRTAAAAGRLVLMPARVAVRTPLLRRAADRLALEAMTARLGAEGRLEAVGNQLLEAPQVDALARSLAEHRVVERVARPTLDAVDVEAAVASALAEERTLRLVEQALESRLAAQLTDRVLHSPELESAVEEIAASPAVRAALTRQTTSLADEVAARVRRRAVGLDDAFERTARRWLRRAQRAGPS